MSKSKPKNPSQDPVHTRTYLLTVELLPVDNRVRFLAVHSYSGATLETENQLHDAILKFYTFLAAELGIVFPPKLYAATNGGAKPTPCPRCDVMCESKSKAQIHCPRPVKLPPVHI